MAVGTILASAIVNKAEIIIQDTTNVRWSADELFGWLKDGQREVVVHKPDASVTVASVICIEGTKQTLPAAAIQLIDVVRNMGTNGTTAGNAVRLIDRAILDAQNPGWHSDSDDDAVVHYMFDSRSPKTFYVTPPQPSADFGYLELVYSSPPSDPAAIGNAIEIDDIYSNVLLDYILYRAYSKDTNYAGNKELAFAHYEAFSRSLGIKQQIEGQDDPNRNTNPQQ